MRLDFLNQLLAKRMSRKEFLIYLGVLFLTITGIASTLKTLSNPHLTLSQPKSVAGFGSGSYGGVKKES